MQEKFKKLPLRSGVGIIVLNKENKVFVGKRIDNPKNFWQMPQGGVDKGEDFLSAAYRELKEETSIDNVELIQEINGTITYELPDHLLGIIWKGKFKGQKQKWFLMRYLGNDEDIDDSCLGYIDESVVPPKWYLFFIFIVTYIKFILIEEIILFINFRILNIFLFL